MQRRDFVTGLGIGSALLGAAAGGARPASAKPQFAWKMVTTWPKNFPALGTGANRLAELIGEMSGGRLAVTVYGADELVPAFGVFDAVARGTAEMGHGSAFYWRDKSPAAQFFSSVPFGMTAQEMNGWIYQGGGLELWAELYGRFGLVPAPAGNSGVQMGGWFNKEIRAIQDFKGLRIRMPGLGGEVLSRVGAITVNLPGGELYAALENGAIDAAEWIGPYNDLAFGFQKVAKYYYYPGWQEPGTIMEAIVNKTAYATLPDDLRSILSNACKVVNQEMLAEYTARNPLALQTLITKFRVELRRFPDPVLDALRLIADEVLGEIARKDDFSSRVHASYKKFQTQSHEWSGILDATDRLSPRSA